MRLTNYELTSIKEVFSEVFKSGEIYLFGSRVDNQLKGGDIDLYLVINKPLDAKERLAKKSKFRLKLEDKIGEQKIDILISKDKNKSVEQEALKKGIML